MVSLSEQNLLKLAQQDEKAGNVNGAISNLEEALNYGRSKEIILKLSEIYRKNKLEDQAYALIKEVPDLFSDKDIFKEYCLVLQANNYYIEYMQLKHLSDKEINVKITPVNELEQAKIIQNFKKSKKITQLDFQQLLKLNLLNYQSFAQSLLLDPACDFALRLALCEDLIKLGIKKKISTWVLNNLTEFVPVETQLLEKNTAYREIVTGIADKFKNNPSQLNLMLGETNLVLGSLYPELNKYIKNTDSFTKYFINYLKNHKGGSYQDLFERIYNNLPK